MEKKFKYKINKKKIEKLGGCVTHLSFKPSLCTPIRGLCNNPGLGSYKLQ